MRGIDSELDSELIEQLLLPWWKGVVYILVIAFSAVASAVAIKITFTFNLNEWMERKAEERTTREVRKRAMDCAHSWTLYPSSPYSQCVSCQSWISTSILMVAREYGVSPAPRILAEFPGAVVQPRRGMVVVSNYMGVEQEN